LIIWALPVAKFFEPLFKGACSAYFFHILSINYILHIIKENFRKLSDYLSGSGAVEGFLEGRLFSKTTNPWLLSNPFPRGQGFGFPHPPRICGGP
jgi:hypothetical protein